ncbi:MAG: hypothetical protein J0I18_22085 [Actinobacteria bacterium]|nr:hypothetical protein [Actinomycetota bacterium]
MNFFPADPTEDEGEGSARVPEPWWKPSDEELPATFPIGETIAVTESVAMILTIARVYGNGVELVVERTNPSREHTSSGLARVAAANA